MFRNTKAVKETITGMIYGSLYVCFMIGSTLFGYYLMGILIK